MNSHDEHCCCNSQRATPSVHQTLDEMEFQRSIWAAALDGDSDRVGSFLKKSTDPNIRDGTGYTALHYASRAGHRSVCELLLHNGACVNAQTHGGATALHRASYCGRGHIVTLLLKHGADPTLTDDDGSTALHKYSRCTVLKKLHYQGTVPSSNIVLRNRLMDQQRQMAAEQGHLEVCEVLVSSSPVLKTVKDKRTRLPVDLCRTNNALLELLKPPQ